MRVWLIFILSYLPAISQCSFPSTHLCLLRHLIWGISVPSQRVTLTTGDSRSYIYQLCVPIIPLLFLWVCFFLWPMKQLSSLLMSLTREPCLCHPHLLTQTHTACGGTGKNESQKKQLWHSHVVMYSLKTLCNSEEERALRPQESYLLVGGTELSERGNYLESNRAIWNNLYSISHVIQAIRSLGSVINRALSWIYCTQ
jgi:hypothetical protein